MARAAAFVGGLICGVALGTAVLVGHADDVQAEVAAAAAAAHVDATDLRGAVNSTGVDPWTYLRAVGELEPPPREPVVPPNQSVWQKLAQCESTGNWHANTGNGFFGGIQFDRQTWLDYGGGAYAARADLATPSQQMSVAERLRAARGFQPWPACSRALGLR